MAVDMFTLVWSLVYKLSPRIERLRANTTSKNPMTVYGIQYSGHDRFRVNNASQAAKEALKQWEQQKLSLKSKLANLAHLHIPFEVASI